MNWTIKGGNVTDNGSIGNSINYRVKNDSEKGFFIIRISIIFIAPDSSKYVKIWCSPEMWLNELKYNELVFNKVFHRHMYNGDVNTDISNLYDNLECKLIEENDLRYGSTELNMFKTALNVPSNYDIVAIDVIICEKR